MEWWDLNLYKIIDFFASHSLHIEIIWLRPLSPSNNYRLKTSAFWWFPTLCRTVSSICFLRPALIYHLREILSGVSYGFAVDTWAVGCVMLACLSGVPPFNVNPKFLPSSDTNIPPGQYCPWNTQKCIICYVFSTGTRFTWREGTYHSNSASCEKFMKFLSISSNWFIIEARRANFTAWYYHTSVFIKSNACYFSTPHPKPKHWSGKCIWKSATSPTGTTSTT